MSTKIFTKVSETLSETLSKVLTPSQREAVMSAWISRRNEVSKLLNPKAKTKKDPTAPKKWKSSFIFFCLDKRTDVKSANPTASAVQVSTILGEKWQALSDREKKKYETQSAQDKVRYEEEMKSYVPPEGTELPKKKEKTGPKRPLSAYMYFCQAMRNKIKTENSSMNGKQITSLLGSKWNALTDAEKAPYEKQYSNDKLRYEKEKGVEQKQTSSKTETKKVAAVVEKKVETKQTKQTTSSETAGFKCFCDEQRDDIQDENPSWSSKKVNAELSKRWNSLSEDSREAYEMEAGDIEEITEEDA